MNSMVILGLYGLFGAILRIYFKFLPTWKDRSLERKGISERFFRTESQEEREFYSHISDIFSFNLVGTGFFVTIIIGLANLTEINYTDLLLVLVDIVCVFILVYEINGIYKKSITLRHKLGIGLLLWGGLPFTILFSPWFRLPFLECPSHLEIFLSVVLSFALTRIMWIAYWKLEKIV